MFLRIMRGYCFRLFVGNMWASFGLYTKITYILPCTYIPVKVKSFEQNETTWTF